MISYGKKFLFSIKMTDLHSEDWYDEEVVVYAQGYTEALKVLVDNGHSDYKLVTYKGEQSVK